MTKKNVGYVILLASLALGTSAFCMQQSSTERTVPTRADMTIDVQSLPDLLQWFQNRFNETIQAIEQQVPTRILHHQELEAQVKNYRQDLENLAHQFLNGENLTDIQLYDLLQQMTDIKNKLMAIGAGLAQILRSARQATTALAEKTPKNSVTVNPAPIQPSIAIDPIERIILPHSIDKRVIEGVVITSLLVQEGKEIEIIHSTIDLTNRPPEIFAQGAATISQRPVLSQVSLEPNKTLAQLLPTIEFTDSTNYCGYYAIHNLAYLIKKEPENIGNRTLFVQHFRSMLHRIRETPHADPYDNIDNHEIVQLLQAEYGINPDQYVILSIDGNKKVQCLDQSGLHLLHNFLFDGNTVNKLTILLCEGYQGAGHWIVVHVSRESVSDQNSGRINFAVYDSLGRIDWHDREFIDTKLLPLYKLLTDPELYCSWF